MMNKKVFLVIGASRGIGKALVEIIAKDPNNSVIALARSKHSLENYFDGFSNVHSDFIDLQSDSLKEDLSNVLNSYDRIDYMINNAGKLVNKPFLELTQEDFDTCYQINAIGVMKSVQVAVPKMLAFGGHVVNISTVGAFQGSVKFPGLTAYSTSKAAVTSFTELFSEEYKKTKITMNCLCLGAVQTEMLEEAFPGYKASISAESMAKYIYDFTTTAHKYMSGKIIPVSLSTP